MLEGTEAVVNVKESGLLPLVEKQRQMGMGTGTGTVPVRKGLGYHWHTCTAMLTFRRPSGQCPLCSE